MDYYICFTFMNIQIFIRNNFGVDLLNICFNYDPNSMKFDERHIGIGTIDGIPTAVIFRTYYP